MNFADGNYSHLLERDGPGSPWSAQDGSYVHSEIVDEYRSRRAEGKSAEDLKIVRAVPGVRQIAGIVEALNAQDVDSAYVGASW